MHSSDIATRASFDHLRYAQLWEDADVLTQALGDQAGGTLVSICSAGDNALAMLTLDPARVVVVDLSPAQIAWSVAFAVLAIAGVLVQLRQKSGANLRDAYRK